MEELVGKPLRVLSEAIHAKEVKSAELVGYYLERIGQLNPQLNAVVNVLEELAMKRARKADVDAENGNFEGILHGIPMTIKDSLDTLDAVTTWGTEGRKDFRPGADATCVGRLRDEGAILLGKTNTPEFTMSFTTNNPIHGRTSNPYDLARSPGGSSGGAAAAIAAGMTPFDVGTDTAGSIRLPSHFCGITGIKPTPGRVPCTGNSLPSSGLLARLTQPGPMSRHVEDLVLLLPLMAGPDGFDPNSVAAVYEDPRAIDPLKLRVGFHTDNGIKPAGDETAAVVEATAGLLADQGVAVEEARPSGIEMAQLIMGRLFTADGGLELECLLDDCRTENPSPGVKAMMARGQAAELDNRDFAQLLVMWDNYRSSMLSFFSAHDVLISPVNASLAPPHETTLDGADYSYTSAYNLAGWPGVVIRGGTSADGLPIGIQILAAPWHEPRTLAMALWLEDALGDFPRPSL